ncbi:DUF2272 domain-containing protein [Achromobacter pestifer]|uniref:DUF2272 domain-containing protein n=1 Tax=Achromobacter pestifer TaxID=1353889 RepID=A0A7D4HU54_9BURK|nr:DUF2272 domain-containing protein [Achromobacter pestifer]QKH38199.1 DUF2272 domain-containing protein [Achromobacter pestifer]
MKGFVNVEAVNLRATPSTAQNAPIGSLTLGQEIVDLGGAPAGWHHVQTKMAGLDVKGYSVDGLADSKFKWAKTKQPTLRPPATRAREALVAAAVEQWLRFDKGRGKENEEPYSGYIHEMWKALGKDLTGKDTRYPWSAVAISLMVSNAAKIIPEFKAFKRSIGHAAYMWDAIKKRASRDMSAPFWGVPITEEKPEVGDIIGSWRETPFTFDQYLEASKNPEAPSHSDIIVAVGTEVALAIGGNVSQSVFVTGYQLTAGGNIAKNQRFRKGKLVGEAIVLMKNRIA